MKDHLTENGVMVVNMNMRSNFETGFAVEEDADMQVMMGRVQQGLKACEAGNRIMTDDKAPVELLGMKMIDEIIMDEVQYYKGIYEKEGIQGLMNQL